MELLEKLLLILLPAALCLWAYRQGIRDGMAKEAGPGRPGGQVREKMDAEAPGCAPLSDRAVARAKGKPRGQTPEERRMQQIMANVEAYDGTSRGQKEVV